MKKEGLPQSKLLNSKAKQVQRTKQLMVPEIVKQISTQFNSLNQKEIELTVKTDRQMCKAQGTRLMSQATYKTKRLAHDKQSSSNKLDCSL